MSIDLYSRYRAALDQIPPTGPLAPYNWISLPNPMGPEALVYGQMAPAFAQEIANAINQFSQDIRRLRAWAVVCADLSDEDKMEASGEFIEPLATFSLSTPYALKAKFAFAATHLCHQSNSIRDGRAWVDDLPADHDIVWETADQKGPGWRRYGRFKQAAAPLGGARHRELTDDFRNASAHRFASRVLIGVTQPVSRTIETSGRVTYGIGGRPPLGLTSVADLLAEQVPHALKAFGAFQQLVGEQTALFKPAQRS